MSSLKIISGIIPLKQHAVFIVNDTGDKCLHSFGSTRGAGLKHLSKPIRCIVDVYGNILVADQDNHRVLLLNHSLELLRVLITEQNGLKSPKRLHLDEESGRLYVGSEGKVLVFRIK